MIQQCCYCHCIIKAEDGQEPIGEVSHGTCSICYASEMAKLKQENEDVAKAKTQVKEN